MPPYVAVWSARCVSVYEVSYDSASAGPGVCVPHPVRDSTRVANAALVNNFEK